MKNEYTLKDEFSKSSGVIKIFIQIENENNFQAEKFCDDIEYFTNALTSRSFGNNNEILETHVLNENNSKSNRQKEKDFVKETDFNSINIKKKIFYYGNKLYQL